MRFRKITTLIFGLCVAAFCACGVRTFAQTSNDLFASLTGASNAVLKVDKDGTLKFSPSISKKKSDLKYADQRFKAVESILSSRGAEKLANAKNSEGQTPLHSQFAPTTGPRLWTRSLKRGRIRTRLFSTSRPCGAR